MADAPAPSSGSGWGVFEIIVVIVILVAIGNAFNKNGPSTIDSTNNADVASTDTNSVGNCIVSVSTPTKNQSLTSFQVPIRGTTSNCTLNTPDTAFFAQVVGSNGVSISDYTPVHTINATANIIGANSFDGIVTLNKKPTTTSGQIIIVPNITQDGSTTHTLRIPVTFAIK